MIFEINDLYLVAVLSLLIGVCIGVGAIKISEVNQPINESLLNATYLFGYNMGVVDTSQYVLQTGLLPMFNVTNNGLEYAVYLGDINLTEISEWTYNHY